MRAAPINPADINANEGKYPGRRECRQCRDSKARGVVVGVARTFQRLPRRALVILPHNIGTWPKRLRSKRASCGGSARNRTGARPIVYENQSDDSAWRLLHDMSILRAVIGLIQTHATRCRRAVIQLHTTRFKTVNVVRARSWLTNAPRRRDVVLVDRRKLRDQKRCDPGAAIRLGLNLLAARAHCVCQLSRLRRHAGVVRAMSLQPSDPDRSAYFKDLRFRGIWINKWYDDVDDAGANGSI